MSRCEGSVIDMKVKPCDMAVIVNNVLGPIVATVVISVSKAKVVPFVIGNVLLFAKRAVC